MKKVLILIQALFLAFFLAASAAAEAVPQGGKEDPLPLNTDNSGMGTATPQVSLRNAAPYLTGDWGGLRPEFKEKGYTLSSSYVFDVLGNVSGGMERRTVYTHSWGTDIEVDMEKAFGLKGGIFHTSFLWRAGANLSHKYIGNTFTASNIYGSQEFKLYSLYFDQKFFEDKLSLKVGRFTAGDECAASPLYWLYVNNAIDGNPISLPINLPFLTYPNATWGARAKISLPHDIYSYSGIFNGDPRVGRDEAHGCDFSFRLKRGVLLIQEFGWTPNRDPSSEGLPGNYKMGYFYHSGTFRQQYRDANGGSSILSGAPLAKHTGNWGLYWHADQMVYREKGSIDQGLISFVAATYSPDDLNQFPFFIDGGLTYKGLIPGRDKDIASLGFAYGMWSDELAHNAQDNMTYNGANTHKKIYELMFEANYRIQVFPWFYIQPDMQYILHPGGTGYIKDALVIGFQSGVTF